jgi:hypothetical protein
MRACEPHGYGAFSEPKMTPVDIQTSVRPSEVCHSSRSRIARPFGGAKRRNFSVPTEIRLRAISKGVMASICRSFRHPSAISYLEAKTIYQKWMGVL